MICYKDRTYCQYYMLCKNRTTCTTPPLTEDVQKAAIESGLSICVYKDFPDCFIRFFDNSFDGGLGKKE